MCRHLSLVLEVCSSLIEGRRQRLKGRMTVLSHSGSLLILSAVDSTNCMPSPFRSKSKVNLL